MTRGGHKGTPLWPPNRRQVKQPLPHPGRPQGSHPLILTAHALTKTRRSSSPRRLCKGGSGVVWSRDPCGRSGVGRLPATYVYLTLIGLGLSLPSSLPFFPRRNAYIADVAPLIDHSVFDCLANCAAFFVDVLAV